MLGITPTDELEGSHSEIELRMLLRQGERAGVLESDEQQMIDKVFDFSDTPVEDVMVPRPDIVALPVALTPTAAMEQVLQHPYTRYPVYDEEFDNVLGVLHVRRLFVALQNGAAASSDLRALLYPAHLVPETKRLGHLLTEIRRQKGHMAIVVDEYGSVAGLVTLEDLLEEIVGEIDDEFDPEDAPIVRLGPDRYRVEGSLPVEEFNERFDRELSDEDYHTVGGIVFGELGRAPAVGDSVEIGHVKFDVATVDGSRILHADATLLPIARAGRRRRGRRRLVSYRPTRGGAGADLMQAAPLTVVLIAINVARLRPAGAQLQHHRDDGQRHDRRLAGGPGLGRRRLRPVGADGVLRRVVAPDHERVPAREPPPHRLQHAGAVLHRARAGARARVAAARGHLLRLAGRGLARRDHRRAGRALDRRLGRDLRTHGRLS